MHTGSFPFIPLFYLFCLTRPSRFSQKIEELPRWDNGINGTAHVMPTARSNQSLEKQAVHRGNKSAHLPKGLQLLSGHPFAKRLQRQEDFQVLEQSILENMDHRYAFWLITFLLVVVAILYTGGFARCKHVLFRFRDCPRARYGDHRRWRD